MMVMVWLATGVADTVWNAPEVIIGGRIVSVVSLVVVASAVASATITNCCRNGRVTLVTGLTAKIVEMVNTSPAFKVDAEVQPLVERAIVPVSLDSAQVVVRAPVPATLVTPPVARTRVPVVSDG